MYCWSCSRLHGANKTGVPFTNDFSGILLRKVLHEISLNNVFITNAVRCFPKNNRPLANEKNNCQKFTQKELYNLKKLRVIVTLGEVAYKQVVKVYGLSSSIYKFKHGNIVRLNNQLCLISSYHCSKLNINTGKLSRDILKHIPKSDENSDYNKNFLKDLPTAPGVYKMLDESRTILYIGKQEI